MEILKQTENKLLARKEVLAKIAEKIPSMSRHEIKAQLAKSLKTKEELIVIEKIAPSYGTRAVEIMAYVYDNPEILKRVTPKHILDRNKAPEVKSEAEGAN